ncbi:MAG: two-component sensor histidine kinase [Burkholderiaceae bacterium]|nr:two-component sensor histidine kinase [Burkholderiaceae bacterium]
MIARAMPPPVGQPVASGASRYLATPTSSFWKSLRYLADARLAVTCLLLAYIPLFGRQSAGEQAFDAAVYLPAVAAYFVVAIAWAVIARITRRGFHVQLLGQVLVDIAVVGLVMHAAGGARSGLGVLMLMPTAGAAILSTPLLSLFIAATASLVLLGESLWRSLQADATAHSGTDGGLFVAAVISAILFVTAVLVNRLARRLTDQERLAFRRGEDLRNQLAINELVIAELDRGVVVFDAAGGVKGINPTARQMLGLPDRDVALAAGSAAATGALATLRALVGSRQPQADLSVGGGRSRLRAQVLSGSSRSGPLKDRVVLLEDLDRIEARAQQLKLASMGRLSASIAHEIRNPLGAIRHAGNLLAEQVPPGPLSRMTAIIEENSLRIDRIVEDVLSIARRTATREAVSLPQFFNTFLPEFVAQADTSWERITVRLGSREPIYFDPNHLRQVLVNLLGNALRYASDSPGAIMLSWDADGSRGGALRILDDGPGISAGNRRHLFEPFFTTEARGTGLGLHMAQELCAVNGAHLRYESRAGERHAGGFVIEPEPAPLDAQARAEPDRSYGSGDT